MAPVTSAATLPGYRGHGEGRATRPIVVTFSRVVSIVGVGTLKTSFARMIGDTRDYNRFYTNTETNWL